MPHRAWKHRCGESESLVWLGVEVCPTCKCRGTYDGWRYSMIEAMGAYQQRTGLKPIGPHGALAHRLLEGFFERCAACAGRGLLDDGASWRLCPECRGATAVLVGDPADLAEARRRIAEAFPDALVDQGT